MVNGSALWDISVLVGYSVCRQVQGQWDSNLQAARFITVQSHISISIPDNFCIMNIFGLVEFAFTFLFRCVFFYIFVLVYFFFHSCSGVMGYCVYKQVQAVCRVA